MSYTLKSKKKVSNTQDLINHLRVSFGYTENSLYNEVGVKISMQVVSEIDRPTK